MKYRKKPVVIEAFQLTKEVALDYFINKKPLPFDVGLSGSHHPKRREVYSARAVIQTLEGSMVANLGDWIIKGAKGELYPCKSDIFEATYEPVAE